MFVAVVVAVMVAAAAVVVAVAAAAVGSCSCCGVLLSKSKDVLSVVYVLCPFSPKNCFMLLFAVFRSVSSSITNLRNAAISTSCAFSLNTS